MYRHLKYAVIDFFVENQERIALWMPVSFACGIGFYFTLLTEPSITTISIAFLLFCFLAWDSRFKNAAFSALIFPCLFCAGVLVAKIETDLCAAPKLKGRTGVVSMTGTIKEAAHFSAGGGRLIVGDVDIPALPDWKTPTNVLLSLGKDFAFPQTGDRIKADVVLQELPAPATPDGFDMARQLYFQKIGARGYVKGDFKIIKTDGRFYLRDTINRKIDAVMTADTAGVAKALVTGNAKSVSPMTAQAYRDAGIAHILAVSGLHMSLLAGLFFVVLRSILALIPAIALCWNTKKIAAVLSIIACFGYLHISGASFPAQRAFIMVAMLLGAILFNRRALSVVSIGWAAFIILLFSPHSLLSVGFQLSFAAVLALVCACEAGFDKAIRLLRQKESVLFILLSCLGGIVLTSLIASTATAPLTIYHFKRMPVYAIIGNVLTSGITGMWVMPSLTAGTLMMPFGAEKPFLILASWGISWINHAAVFTAGLPAAVSFLPPMPTAGLLLSVFGGLWLCLWKTKSRLLGLLPFCIGLTTPFIAATPDVYITPAAFAFKDDTGRLVFKEGNSDKQAKNVWLSDNRQTETLTDYCPYGLCVYEKNGIKIGYAHTRIGAFDACERTDLDALFITARFDERCPAKRQFNRFALTKAGVFALYLTEDGLIIKSVGQSRGFRPWTTGNR